MESTALVSREDDQSRGDNLHSGKVDFINNFFEE
jgi:hypothetical protein